MKKSTFTLNARPNLILSLNLSLLFLFASCTAGGEQSSSTTTLVFKHGKLTGDPGVIQGLLREFEQEHPGVVVQEEVLPASTDQQHQYYAINLDSRHIPFDVLAVDVIWVSEFARAGWIRSLNRLLPPAERGDYFESALQAATFDHEIYAIPWYIDAGVLYYRRDLLARHGFDPPRTWPDLVHMVRTVLDAERDPALKGFLWTGKQYEGLVCVALEFMWSHGGNIMEASGMAGAEIALAFMRNLIREGISPELVSTADEEATRLLFADGRAIFMRNWPYVWSLLQQDDSPLRGQVGVTTLPAFPGYQPASALGGWMLAVPARSAHPRLAEEFIAFLSTPPVQQRLALELGYHPARRSVYADAALRRAHPSLDDVFPVLMAARPRPVTPYYLSLSQILQPELSAAIVGRKTAEAALVSIRKQMANLGVADVIPHQATPSVEPAVALR
ncbi:MAG: ABC transporter substrate-binding protein [Nitrospiraceae bacterium]